MTIVNGYTIKPGANLTGANLSWADLTGADLTGANLTDANLTRADLREANLTRADLTRADLTRANLTRADLTRADLSGADLTRADLSEANLTRANLSEANLTGAIIPYTMLDERGYSLAYQWDGDTLWFYAGCRTFTLDQAIAHWSSLDYPDAQRGQRYVKTCQFLHEMNEAGLLLSGKVVE